MAHHTILSHSEWSFAPLAPVVIFDVSTLVFDEGEPEFREEKTKQTFSNRIDYSLPADCNLPWRPQKQLGPDDQREHTLFIILKIVRYSITQKDMRSVDVSAKRKRMSGGAKTLPQLTKQTP